MKNFTAKKESESWLLLYFGNTFFFHCKENEVQAKATTTTKITQPKTILMLFCSVLKETLIESDAKKQ